MKSLRRLTGNEDKIGEIGKMDYSKAGVDIEKGDEASKILYEAARKTFENRKGKFGEIIVPFDDFSGIRAVDVSSLPKGSMMCMNFDGIGTKVEIAQRMNNFETVAFDLFAMVCDDAIVRGGEPVLIGSVLDVNKVDVEAVRQLAKGYVEAAEEAGVSVINGELAELGNLVSGFGGFNFNWCSSVLWFANEQKLITGENVSVGDSIVFFEEEGFRSNGLSLARKVFEKEYGSEWHDVDLSGKRLGEHVLFPSKIYSKIFIDLYGGFDEGKNCDVKAVAHITGGGIPGKLGRALKPSGYGAEIDDAFNPCEADRKSVV